METAAYIQKVRNDRKISAEQLFQYQKRAQAYILAFCLCNRDDPIEKHREQVLHEDCPDLHDALQARTVLKKCYTVDDALSSIDVTVQAILVTDTGTERVEEVYEALRDYVYGGGVVIFAWSYGAYMQGDMDDLWRKWFAIQWRFAGVETAKVYLNRYVDCQLFLLTTAKSLPG